MAREITEQAKLAIIGEYIEWVKRFDVNDYVKNRPMIEKLYEEKQMALASSVQLEDRVKKLETNIHELEMQNQKLVLQLDEANHKSLLLYVQALLATILIGIGANIATSTSYGWTGWIMIGAGCLLELIAFFSRPTTKR